MMMITWLSAKPMKVPLSPTSVKNRRKETPSTTCGIISGDRKKAVKAARPGKRWRAIASEAGTEMASAMLAETIAR